MPQNTILNASQNLLAAGTAAKAADERKKKEAEKPAPKEQSAIAWLLGFKESDDQKAAREAREARDKRTQENVKQAIQGFGTLKKVVKDADKK